MEDRSLLENINRHITLTENECSLFLSLLKKKKIPRKNKLLTQGQLCDSIYFVDCGALRAFYLDVSGRESTIMFAVKDWWVTDMYCFINILPAMLTIEAIEESTVYQLKKNDLEKLHQNSKKAFKLRYRLIQLF